MAALLTMEVFFSMEPVTILNHCHRFPGFVYESARFSRDEKKTIEVVVRPRKGSALVCSGCQQPAPGYDHQPERRFEFHSSLGISGLPAACHAARELPHLWGGGGRSSLGVWETPVDQCLYGASGPLGAQALLEGNRGVLSYLLGQGPRRGRVDGQMGTEASRAVLGAGHRRGRNPIRQRPQLPGRWSIKSKRERRVCCGSAKSGPSNRSRASPHHSDDLFLIDWRGNKSAGVR